MNEIPKKKIGLQKRTGWLVTYRREGECVVLGDDIQIQIKEIKPKSVKLAINANGLKIVLIEARKKEH